MKYLKQLKKVEFGLGKIRETNRNPIEYRYDMENFFIHCFHLKDHLIMDKSIPGINKNVVEGFLNNNKYLRLCADLANRIKHLALTKYRENAQFGKSDIDVYQAHTITATAYLSIQFIKVKDGVTEESPEGNIESNPPYICNSGTNDKQCDKGIHQRYHVIDNMENDYDALTLATKCYESWLAFLTEHGLPIK